MTATATGAIDIIDEGGNSLLNNPGTDHAFFFAHGRDSKGAFTDAGIAAAAVCAGGMDEENCDGDAVFRGLGSMSLGTPADYFDDFSVYSLQAKSDGNHLWARSPSNFDDIYNLNAGNVGIGTSTPRDGLEIAGTGFGISIDSENDGGYGGIFERSGALVLSGKHVLHDQGHVFIKDSGKVGIGIDDPDSKLHIDGDITVAETSDDTNSASQPRVSGKISFWENDSLNSGYIYGGRTGGSGLSKSLHIVLGNTSVGGAYNVDDTSRIFIGVNGSGSGPETGSIVMRAARIGVGTNDPVSKLDVAGEVKIGNSGLACPTTNPAPRGAMRYNNTTDMMEFCSVTGWRPIAAGNVQLLASNRPVGNTTNVPAGSCSLIEVQAVLKGYPHDPPSDYLLYALTLTMNANGNPLAGPPVEMGRIKGGSSGHFWGYGGTTSQTYFIQPGNTAYNINGTIENDGAPGDDYHSVDARYSVLCY